MSYGFGDACGNGYGVAVHLKYSISYRYRHWMSEVGKESSNYRVENPSWYCGKLYQEGCLQICKLFIFTGNIVANYAYHKGTLSSKTLFNLILRSIKF